MTADPAPRHGLLTVRRGSVRTGAWLGIELRHLAALQALAKHKSFVRAARHLGYTQSAVSQQIAGLERVVGKRLIERPRGSQPVGLTEAGRVLLGHADAILEQLATAQADLDDLARGSTGTLRLGAYQSVAARVLPLTLRAFLGDRGGADVRLSEGITDLELLVDLERGELDLCYADDPLPTGPFASEAVLRDPFVLVVDTGSRIAASHRAGAIDFGRVGTLPLVCFESLRSTEHALAYLLELGAVPEIVLRSDHITTVQGAVAAGIGAALIPRMSYDASDPLTECVDLGADAPVRQVCLAWHSERELTPIARAFVDLSRRVAVRVVEAEARRVRRNGASSSSITAIREVRHAGLRRDA